MGRLHVVFFNRSFYPDMAATGQLLTELCEDLVHEHGCRVSVVAGIPMMSVSEHVEGIKKGIVIDREEYAGIEIIRAKGTRFSKRRFVGRVSNYMSYFLSAFYAGLRLDRPDIVVALTDPPIIGLAAYLVSRRFRAPFVMSYRDIFPEVARLLEDFQSSFIERLLEKVNKFLVQAADKNVALGKTMRTKLIEEKGADPEKTVVIPDWADCSEIKPRTKSNPFSTSHGLDEKFVVMHSGNIGLSQGLETLVEAAGLLKEYPDIDVVFVGDGVKKSSLQELVREKNLENVRFLPFQPKEGLGDSFASADVFIISLKRGLAGYIVPSKLYGILAAGRPYVAAVEKDCEVTSITKKFDCGLLVNPGDAPELAEKILRLYKDKSSMRRLGENARKAALMFDRGTQVRAYHALFCSLTSAGTVSA